MKGDKTMKETIIKLLKSTNREGIDDLIAYMEDNGFFDAPCSGNHHLAQVGGLAEHSLNVYDLAMQLYDTFGGEDVINVSPESVIICALLHDLGKMGQYGKPNYVENVLKSGKVSGSQPYKTNPDLQYIDHEIRSIAIASKYIELTEDEQFAIIYHNGLYGNLRYAISGKETPLYMIIHFADMWASRVIEVDEGGDE